MGRKIKTTSEYAKSRVIRIAHNPTSPGAVFAGGFAEVGPTQCLWPRSADRWFTEVLVPRRRRVSFLPLHRYQQIPILQSFRFMVKRTDPLWEERKENSACPPDLPPQGSRSFR